MHFFAIADDNNFSLIKINIWCIFEIIAASNKLTRMVDPSLERYWSLKYKYNTVMSCHSQGSNTSCTFRPLLLVCLDSYPKLQNDLNHAYIGTFSDPWWPLRSMYSLTLFVLLFSKTRRLILDAKFFKYSLSKFGLKGGPGLWRSTWCHN